MNHDDHRLVDEASSTYDVDAGRRTAFVYSCHGNGLARLTSDRSHSSPWVFLVASSLATCLLLLIINMISRVALRTHSELFHLDCLRCEFLSSSSR